MLDYEKSFIAMCKFLAWLSFSLFITFIGLSGVFADEHNMGSYTNYTEVLLDIPNAGAPVGLNRDTYNSAGQFYTMWVNIGNLTINKDYIYQMEIQTPGSKLTNVNTVIATQTSNNAINQSCNILGFSDANIGWPKIYFQCPNSFSNGTMTFTYFNNSGTTQGLTNEPQYFKWYSTNFRYYDNQSDVDLDFSDITTNANANAQNIINNQNQNTQNIINNQNQNTQNVIDSQIVCFNKIIDNSDIIKHNSYLSSTGNVIIGSNTGTWGITDYIDNFDNIKVVKYRTSIANTCFYTDNKTLISCITNSDMSLNSDLTIPANTKYVRFSINDTDNAPQFELKVCKNGNQALDDSINNLNDNLNNDDTTGATSEASDFFSSFTTNTFGLTSIITAPLNLINSVLSSTCNNLELPLPYLDNKKLILPCMTSIYSQYFGTFFTIYQTITYGIIAYWVCVRIFNQVKDFKNPEHDEIEVMDL